VWVDILRGKMGPTKAITMRRLKTQGPFLQLLAGGNRIIRWVEILRTIPTEFEGSYAQYNLPGEEAA
jgi:putative sterol carrier protein